MGRRLLYLIAATCAVAWCSSLVIAGQQSAPAPRPQPSPTPRLADGTPNLGRVPGEKGVWNVPYIQNMADHVVGGPGRDPARGAGRAGGGGGAGAVGGGGAGAVGGAVVGVVGGAVGGADGVASGGRGGSRSEPHVPFMPWAAAVYDYNSANVSKYDPEGYCLPPGGPRMMATPYPMEIVQLPEQRRIFMVFEGATHIWREIYMDGRPHPEGDALNPTYLGHSVGRWEADTLVVDIVGFNEGTWIDYYGHPHTGRLHVVERISRPDKGTLRYEATFDDPGAYTRPWTVNWNVPWNPTGELAEYICQENNRYLWNLTDDFGQPIFGPRP